MIDGGGSLVRSVNFDAFGNIASQTGSGELGLYAWTGRELDVETGLQYNRARYYDSTTGRWISQDPMGFDAGDSNLYRYVNNRRTTLTDPSGMEVILSDPAAKGKEKREKGKVPLNIVFADEKIYKWTSAWAARSKNIMVGDTETNIRLWKQTASLTEKLVTLRDQKRINVFYITENATEDTIEQFGKHVARMGRSKNTVNIYAGHGFGEVPMPVDPFSVKKFARSLEGIKEADNIKIAVLSCYCGDYNKVIQKFESINGNVKATKVVLDADFAEGFVTQLTEAIKLLDTNKNTVLNLYFSAYDMRKDVPGLPFGVAEDGTYRFVYWK